MSLILSDDLIVSEARKSVHEMLDKRSAHDGEGDFPIDGIPIELKPHEPTKLSARELTRQLKQMGLTCSETRGKRLEKNIAEVHNKIGVGSLQAFGIFKDNGLTSKIFPVNIAEMFTSTAFGNYIEEGWSEHSFGKYETLLSVIQQRDNFEKLKQEFSDFPYAECNEQTITQFMTTVEAIKELFIETAQICTSATVEGITRDTLDAAFSNALDALNESAFEEDYDVPNDRIIFLLLNYDEKSQQADGIGVVTCKWRIQINNYKEKKSDSVRLQFAVLQE